ncbi:AraC family transcriptional regulator [Pacificimonas sp. WHA3]|uniref:AraC family transcriptional regulator n=1 Tax=Pacificimonas pallii TaxID=2827236 RepID=A0ABS6SH00_9SPHN|nr:helix-turn-helix domain-containing protein [Pacificimonas pallii]MBV7257313.1 AraC family transcriptional regulator [Pacificimonas pallii]
MIDMRFYVPAPDLRAFISSYYVLDFQLPALSDIVQAEQASVRFALGGRYRIGLADDAGWTDRNGANLFGHRTKPMMIEAEGPGRFLGAGILPSGFEALLGVPADEMTDRIVPLQDVVGGIARRAHGVMQAHTEAFCGNDAILVDTANAFFRALATRREARGAHFQSIADEWLAGSANPRVDDLIAACDVSARQVERLCRTYFGVSPKMLARKSRVLRSAVQLRLTPGLRWQDAAGSSFYDQSHFIREFKAFTGLTPLRYAQLKTPMMEQSMRTRAQHRLIPRLSLLS